MPDSVIRKHYMLTMRLDLSCMDVVYLQSLTQRLQNAGLGVSTLYQEQAAHADAIKRVYLCHLECRKRQPPVELRQEPIAFDKWLASVVVGADALPELCFLAVHRQEYVGICIMEQNTQYRDILVSGFTGILPAWTGRGIAKALKAHSLLCAQQCGFRYIETSVLVVNRSMCAINCSLGFQIVRRHLHAYPISIASADT